MNDFAVCQLHRIGLTVQDLLDNQVPQKNLSPLTQTTVRKLNNLLLEPLAKTAEIRQLIKFGYKSHLLLAVRHHPFGTLERFLKKKVTFWNKYKLRKHRVLFLLFRLPKS